MADRLSNSLYDAIANVNTKIDNELQFPNASSGGGLGLRAFTDSGNNFMVFRLNQDTSGQNYFQIIFWGQQKKITIVRCVNGTETTLATFTGA